MPDLVLRAGRLIDGTGTAPVTTDIAVRDGHIAEIGRIRSRAHRTINADGALVVPGFIAILPPATVAPFDRNALRHLAPGTTTTLETVPQDLAGGDAGADYVTHLRSAQSLTNRTLLANHSAMRGFVMGNRIRDELPASSGDHASMADLLSDTLSAGARGILFDPESSAEERISILRALAVRWSQHSGDRSILALLSPKGPDPDEALHEARRLISLVEEDPPLNCSVVVAFTEPLDDPDVATALLPGDEPSIPGIRAKLMQARSIVGPGLNPLALLGAFAGTEAIPQESLVHRLAATAMVLGLAHRGTIESDSAADMNIIDPSHLGPDLTSGLVSTLVAGTEIVSFDELTGEAPGRVL